ncbi:dihydrofolate reductase [Teratosphaeria destructans]|uniref:Dihydrofolate reductase n=1 Tax=Teratosphaeria destructans TaxID=418781 RepID=A0A9W7SVV3_9PEZI|nr:dihydrofolate reductase [Teratosphaeria destructans]
MDTVVSEERSLGLVEACVGGGSRVVYHPGGHFVPGSQRVCVDALVAFIREVLGGEEGKAGEEEEEVRVEDMDVPF